ncbi:MAG: hypothetical protein LBK96_00355, partial [Prevotellaceae bacterium]|nr:hypothetical protein [Prevotellaceae bacterium]
MSTNKNQYYKHDNLLTLPLAFEESMKVILGDEYPDFESSMHEAPSVSIRFNSGVKFSETG